MVLALVIGGFLAVQHASGGPELTSATDTGSGKPRVRFVKNPREIPELTMTTIDGKTITTKDLSGK